MGLAVCAAMGCLAACRPPASPQQRFDAWAATPAAAGLATYQATLRRHQVDAVVPLPGLLRSGRRWRACGIAEFILPPTPRQADMVPTLQALRALQGGGLLAGAQVASGYRDASINRCEGGSSKSRHLDNNALDLDIPAASPAATARLCAWWRRHGAAWRLGLGVYDDHRVHIDTSGFRTWGPDYTRHSSACLLQ